MSKSIKIILALLLVCGASFSQDSSLVNHLKDIEELRIENKLLNGKIDILNSTNEKILNSVYFTIGAILAVLVGLSVWNSIKTQRLNDEKFKEHIESTKHELTHSLAEQIDKKVASKSFSEISDIRSDVYNIRNTINSLKEDYIIDNLQYHPYHKNSHDRDRLLDFVKLVTENKMIYSYDQVLETIKAYAKANEYLHYTDKPKLLSLLDEYFGDAKYKYQVAEIKTLLENHKN